MAVEVTKEGNVFILTMKAGENRFNDDFMVSLGKALDQIEASTGPAALVTIGEDKFWSNGLDLSYVGVHSTSDPEFFSKFLKRYLALMARFLTFPMPTVAAINGHAFAGGMIMAMAHDFRVMRANRGFLCMPEVDLHMALTPGMNAVVVDKLSGDRLAKEVILLGKRYGGKEALRLQIVDAIVEEDMPDSILRKAVELAQSLTRKGEDRTTFRALKEELYFRSYSLLKEGVLSRKASAKL